MTVLLPVVVEGLKSTNHDVQLGSLIIVSRLAAKVEMTNEAMQLLIDSILSRRVTDQEDDTLEAMLTTLIIICESQGNILPFLPKKSLSRLLRHPAALDTILSLVARYAATHFLKPMLATIVDACSNSKEYADIMFTLLAPVTCPRQVTSVALPLLLEASLATETFPDPQVRVLQAISQHASEEYSKACDILSRQGNLAGKANIQKLKAYISGVRGHIYLPPCWTNNIA